jgi:hypothetical protein
LVEYLSCPSRITQFSLFYFSFRIIHPSIGFYEPLPSEVIKQYQADQYVESEIAKHHPHAVAMFEARQSIEQKYIAMARPMIAQPSIPCECAYLGSLGRTVTCPVVTALHPGLLP